jgi:hypothetical protein
MAKKMDPLELQAIVQSARYNALAGMASVNLSTERADAMDYYLGRMDKDMPPQEGRSKTVSMDVADTIEGLLPNLMEVMAGSDEVVVFNPVGPEDEKAAQQETDYVNHVFMQRNPGWRVLYDFTKDGLMSKVGIAKIWWEETEEEQRETYYDLSEDQFALLSMAVQQSEGQMKIIEHTVNNGPDDDKDETN